MSRLKKRFSLKWYIISEPGASVQNIETVNAITVGKLSALRLSRIVIFSSWKSLFWRHCSILLLL